MAASVVGEEDFVEADIVGTDNVRSEKTSGSDPD
jgi:hypothetical protein